MKEPLIEIKNASEGTVLALLKLGLLYIGEDNRLHVIEKIPTAPTKA